MTDYIFFARFSIQKKLDWGVKRGEKWSNLIKYTGTVIGLMNICWGEPLYWSKRRMTKVVLSLQNIGIYNIKIPVRDHLVYCNILGIHCDIFPHSLSYSSVGHFSVQSKSIKETLLLITSISPTSTDLLSIGIFCGLLGWKLWSRTGMEFLIY